MFPGILRDRTMDDQTFIIISKVLNNINNKTSCFTLTLYQIKLTGLFFVDNNYGIILKTDNIIFLKLSYNYGLIFLSFYISGMARLMN